MVSKRKELVDHLVPAPRGRHAVLFQQFPQPGGIQPLYIFQRIDIIPFVPALDRVERIRLLVDACLVDLPFLPFFFEAGDNFLARLAGPISHDGG